MKRAISMLVAIVMVLSMVPNVFAASETAIVLDDITTIAVALNADNGYYICNKIGKAINEKPIDIV